MPTSQNGWPVPDVDDPDLIGAIPLEVDGVSFGLVRAGKVHELLKFVITEVHNKVEKARQGLGCWGYAWRENVNSPGDWSNHASATAVDFNASKHPNGQPTSQNWTAAQIEQIHAILDQVNGMVRWGGDYQGTPDAMHFEINVPPEELGEDVVVPTSSLTRGRGVGTTQFYYFPNKIPWMEPMTVSYPTPAKAVRGQAMWLFRADRSGRISIDALLSHYMEEGRNTAGGPGPTVSLDLQKVTWSEASRSWSYAGPANAEGYAWSYYLPDYGTRNQGRWVLNAEPGAVYQLTTTASTAHPWVNIVVRIGQYMDDPEWVQPPDQEIIYGSSDGYRKPQWPAPTASNLDIEFDDNSNVYGRAQGFEGRFELHRAWGGIEPGLDPAAAPCAWRWARRLYNNGIVWWSPGNGGEWEEGEGGTATCPTVSGIDDEAGQIYSDLPVGYIFGSTERDTWMNYQNIYWRVFCSSTIFRPQEALNRVTRTGQGNPLTGQQATYLPQLNSGDRLEWESTTSTISAIYYSWDEMVERSGFGGYNPSGVTVDWYLQEAFGVAPDTTPRIPGQWGPYGTSQWYGQTAEDANNLAGRCQHLGSKADGYGNWYLLGPEWHTKVLRFIAMPDKIYGDAVPDMGGDLTGIGFTLYKAHNFQYMAIRFVVTPSRYRIWRDPGIPDITWGGQSAINMAPEDDGRVFY